MSEVNTSTDETGEGFAFFRWHCMNFPEAHTCVRWSICRQHWDGGMR